MYNIGHKTFDYHAGVECRTKRHSGFGIIQFWVLSSLAKGGSISENKFHLDACLVFLEPRYFPTYLKT